MLHATEQLLKPKREREESDYLMNKNIYFDFTPMEYVTRFLTEDGQKTPDQVKEYIKSIKILLELSTGFE